MKNRTISPHSSRVAALMVVAVVVVGATADDLRAETGHSATRTQRFDQQMQPILSNYLEIGSELAADSLNGVRAKSQAIAKDAGKLDPKSATGKHASHYKNVPRDLKKAALALAKTTTLERARESFKKLSMPMAMWATMSKPKDIDVLYCSMAKASWVQKHGKVRNPYYGAKMLDCGEVVGGDRYGVRRD